MPWRQRPPCHAGRVKRRPATLLALAIATLVVAGCTTAERAAETPAPAATTETTPTPMPSPTPNLEPVLVFDGDCDQMLTGAQRDDALGVGSVTLAEQLALWDPDGRPLVDTEPAGTLGGLACTWYAASGGEGSEVGARLTTMVVPADVVPDDFAATYSVTVCEPNYDTMNCRLGMRAGDTWISAATGSDYEVRDAPVEFLTAAIEAVSQNLPSATQPRPVSRTDQTWTIPDCVALGEAIGLEELMGPYQHGYWEGSEQPEEVLFSAAGVARSCPVFSDYERLDEAVHDFRILRPLVTPGLGWQWPDLRAQAADSMFEIDVDGALDSFGVDRGYGSTQVFATDGTNVVSLYSQDADLTATILARIIAALSR